MFLLIIIAIYLFVGYVRLQKELSSSVLEQTPLVLGGNYFKYILTWPLAVVANKIVPKLVDKNQHNHLSSEVNQTFAILEQARNKFGSSHKLNQIIDLIKTDIINNQDRWTGHIKTIQAPINNRVYQVILLELDEILSSGQFHIYRGMLGLEGQSLFNIANEIIDEFSRTNYWSTSQVAEQKEILANNLKGVG